MTNKHWRSFSHMERNFKIYHKFFQQENDCNLSDMLLQ